tara:strand:- start:22720 stop:23277 length:558 start_codon:yes stop_codon:yes gene_type:complete
MAILDIVQYGNPILRKKCKPVKNFLIIEDLLVDMFDTMYEADGIGLAANQVGFDLSLFIIDITHTDEADEPNIFINPKITSKGGVEDTYAEGCLSFPEITLEVIRPKEISLKYQTLDEKWHEDTFSGLLSRAIQHEMDHLDGIYFIDRISQFDLIKYKQRLLDIESNYKKKSVRLNEGSTKNFLL